MGKSISCLLVTYAGMPYTSSCFFLDNGLANLAGSLLRNGHDVKILDYNTPAVVDFVVARDPSIGDALKKLNVQYKSNDDLVTVQKEHARLQLAIDSMLKHYYNVIYDDIKKEIINQKLDMICFKLWLGRGVNTIINIVSELKKEFPHIKYTAGGPAASLFYKYIDNLDVFDAVGIGEGEMSISELAEYVAGERPLESIGGIVYFKNGTSIYNPPTHEISLDEMVYPEYSQEVYPSAHDKKNKIRVVTLDESRGCRNKCAFCTHSLLGGTKVKVMSIEKLRNVIDYSRNILNTSAFNLGGSCVPGTLLEELGRANLEDGRKILYNCFSNVKDLVGCDFKTIHDGGLFSVFLGIESYHPNVLKNGFNKYLDLDQGKYVINTALREGIYVTCSFIYPGPFETEETRKFTQDMIISTLKNQKKGAAVVFYPGLMPGSRWSQNLEKYGIEAPNIEQHFCELVSCEIRHYLPTSYWDVYDYKIGGISQREAAIMSDVFAQELDENGVNVNIMGDTALLAHFLGQKSELVGENLKNIFQGMDYKGMYSFVEEVNHSIISV